MKKLFIGFVFLLSLHEACFAEIYFPDTKPEQKVQKYNRENVRGTDIISYDVFQNQLYYSYIGSSKSTIFNVDSPIKAIIVGSPELIVLSPIDPVGESYFTLRAAGEIEKHIQTTIQVMTEDYEALIEVVLTPFSSQINKVVNLLDGNRDENGYIYTREHFLKQRSQFEDIISKRESLMSKLLYNDSLINFPINQTISVEQSELELVNAIIIDQILFLNVEFRGSDSIELNKDELFLYVTPYEQVLLSENKKKRFYLKNENAILYKNSNGNQSATLTFDLSQTTAKQEFYVELHLSNNIIFNHKINLYLLNNSDKDLFLVEAN